MNIAICTFVILGLYSGFVAYAILVLGVNTAGLNGIISFRVNGSDGILFILIGNLCMLLAFCLFRRKRKQLKLKEQTDYKHKKELIKN